MKHDKYLKYYKEEDIKIKVKITELVTDTENHGEGYNLKDCIGLEGYLVGEDTFMDDAYIVRFEDGLEDVFYREEFEIVSINDKNIYSLNKGETIK